MRVAAALTARRCVQTLRTIRVLRGDPNRMRVILPITDPYVVHHGALGSFATVYLPGGRRPPARGLIRVPHFDRPERRRSSVNVHRVSVNVNANRIAHRATGTILTSVGAVMGAGSDWR